MTAEAEPDTRVVSEPETTKALPAISAEPPPPPRRRRIPALVLAVTALQIALMAMLTILYPAFTGPDVARKPTPSSRATICASVVLPRPGGPTNST